jgi:hypothetical protein
MTKDKRRIILAFCLGILLSVIGNVGILLQSAPILGQSVSPNVSPNVSPEMAAESVYQRLPYLPLENEYFSQKSGQVIPNSTLIMRFIRYHEYVKSRPLKYRLDWQLTFADYFGINEVIQTDRYPGAETLTKNPYESDRKIIISLTRSQRNQLIDTLVAIYNPPREKPQPPATTPDNSTEEIDNAPVLPQPGDADLLN